RRRIEAANDATRAANKELRLENFSLTRILSERGVFTETQYRQMLMLCHPDNSASPKVKAELLQILVEKKIRLIKADKDKARAGEGAQERRRADLDGGRDRTLRDGLSDRDEAPAGAGAATRLRRAAF